jgi:signal transduction histidine kinase
MAAIATYLDADEDVPAFFGRLCAVLADETRGQRVAFWRLGPRGTLALQPSSFGFSDDSPIHQMRISLGAHGEGALERVILGGEIDLVKGTSPELDEVWRAAGLGDVKASIAAPWRAGGRRIGVVAAYDPPRGFTSRDLWVLQLTGMAAGFLWQYKEAEEELGSTAQRLEEAMSARRHLLNNIASGGDEARRRFASALHDDSLQLLTGAELQLERISTESGAGSPTAAQLDDLQLTLRKVEDSLRRLLTNVSPEPLDLPSDLGQALSERLESMRVRAGIETHHVSRLPRDIPDAIQAIVLKNVAEALTNVEKHAHATRVSVSTEKADGGVRVEVTDNGTGFVMAESLRMPGHIGLVALRERAQLAGGWCRIDSDPGNGTTIEFWVPISE